MEFYNKKLRQLNSYLYRDLLYTWLVWNSAKVINY